MCKTIDRVCDDCYFDTNAPGFGSNIENLKKHCTFWEKVVVQE